MAADLRAALDPAELFERAFALEPLDWQRDYLRATAPWCSKGRQVGASHGSGRARRPHRAVTADVNAAIVSPSLSSRTEITSKARTGLRRLGVRLVQDSTSVLRLANGSRILSLPGTARSRPRLDGEAADPRRGRVHLARDVRPPLGRCAATGGRLVVQSTPAIETGDFHELVTGDDPGWSRLVVRSDEVPTITPAFLAAERRAMSPDAYATRVRVQVRQGGCARCRACSRTSASAPVPRLPGGRRVIVYAVSVRTTGGALVAVDHDTKPPTPVSSSACPYDLGRVADRVRELVAAGHRVTIDLDGRGQSLRLLLGRQPGVRWYRKTGRDRRELTDVLDATAAMPGFRFGPGIAHRDEMRRALESLRRSVDEDG